MNLKNSFLQGTLLLTFAAIISRLLGFFYRIFLANTIGAEGMGIYQLIFPIYGLCFSLCASGIETAVSKLTAEKYALKKPQEAAGILKTALLLTLVLSLSCSLLLHQYAEIIAKYFLKEIRCTQLLRLLAITIPFGTTQSCLCGYYFGIHKSAVPSFAQLTEQGIRIGTTILLYRIYLTNGFEISPTLAVLGLIGGEVFSFLFTITCFSFNKSLRLSFSFRKNFVYLQEISAIAVPLTVGRICVTLLTSLEATMLPQALRAFGLDQRTALSTYGVLTGMVLPFILFPNAFTGSLSIMLLPKISQFHAEGQETKLRTIIQKTFSLCLLLGCTALCFFLLCGKRLGLLVFSNPSAGSFLTLISWICPFLYLNTTLSGILNGLGRIQLTFFQGIFSLFLRIVFICLTVPHIGIYGYLLGLFLSQIFLTVSSIISLKAFLRPSEV